MFKKYIGLYIFGALLLIAGLLGADLLIWRSGVGSTNMTVSETRLTEIKDMVKLCSMEVRDDVAIKDSINGKWIFARNTINGYIRFNLENLDYQVKNDSITIILPLRRLRSMNRQPTIPTRSSTPGTLVFPASAR